MLTKNTQKVKRRVTIIALLLALLFLASPKTVFAGELSNQFSLGMWVRPGTSVASKALLGKAEEMRLATDASGNPLCQIKATTWQTAATSSVALVLNTWAFVACTYDKVTLRVYVNGVQTGSQALTTAVDDTSAVSKIGQDDSASTPYANFIGTVDQLQVYNYARTSKQIVEDMNASHPAGGSPVGSQIGYWKFDEGYGTAINNNGSSGSTYNATLASSPNTPIWSNNGKFGKALIFDGSNDYATINTNLPTLTEGSISMWVNRTGTTGTYQMLFTDSGSQFEMTWNNATTLTFYVNNVGVNTNSALNLNTWYYLAGTFSETGNFQRLYVNGVLVNSSTYPGDATTATRYFGSRAGSYPFNGLIDEAKVYNAALTEDEIKIDYNRGSAMALGSLSDTSGLTGGSIASSSATASYCIPGSTDTCTAPVGEWKFDEKTGASAYDTSGNGNVGVLTNSPSWISGKVGAAVDFTGATNKSIVVTPIGTTLDLTSTGTIQSWVYTSSFDTWNVIVARGNWGGALNEYSLYQQANELRGEIANGTTWNRSIIPSAAATLSGAWHHIAFSWDGSYTRMYLDGRLVDSDAQTVNSTATGNVGIGNTSGGTYNYNGKIDQVRIFNYARTPAQIAWDYNRGKPVGHWKLDECQGSTANDSSGNGNTGTITIGASGTQTAVGTCTTSGAWFNGVTGKFNSSLNFDGTDDVVSIPSTNIINTSSGSVSLWTKPSSTQNGTNYYLFSHFGTNSRIYINTNSTGSNLNGRLGDGTTIGSVNNITANSWHHVVLMWNGTSATFYVDGINRTSTSTFNGLSVVGSTSYIGNYSDAAQGSTGQIDDVRIYNYALTAAQVKNLYNGGAGIKFGPSAGTP